MTEYLNDLLAFLVKHADRIPFVAVAANTMKIQLSYQRILEAIIIGAVLAGIGYVAVIPRLEERLTLEIRQVRADIVRLENRVETIDRERQADYREFRKNAGAKMKE